MSWTFTSRLYFSRQWRVIRGRGGQQMSLWCHEGGGGQKGLILASYDLWMLPNGHQVLNFQPNRTIHSWVIVTQGHFTPALPPLWPLWPWPSPDTYTRTLLYLMLIYPERFAKKDRTDRQKTPFIKLSDFVAAKICVGSTAETNCDLDPTYPKINPACVHGNGHQILIF